MRGRSRNREAGYSVIEIVLLTVLVGIISAVAIARFPSLPKTAPAAEKLAGDIQYAKELAVRLQTMSGVYFIDNTSYRVFQDNDTNKATIDPVTGGAFEVTLSGHLSGVTLG